MALIVQKYGGTSVKNPERIGLVADRVIAAKQAGDNVVVVVSAMAGQTDELIALAHEVNPDPPGREMDMLVSSGEQVSSALLAMAIAARGYAARSFLGSQAGFQTDGSHTRAKIVAVAGDPLHAELRGGGIPIVAGFQGVAESGGDITTLGRGGSDTSAVALAAALGADRCDIYTDVEGVFTCDPRICSDARKLDRVSYEEMLELASMGAKVLQTRSVGIAAKYRVPLRVLSSYVDAPGTDIVPEDEIMEDALVTAVAHNINEAKITVSGVPDQPGIAQKLFTPLARANIVVDMIIQNVSADGLTDMTFTVARSDYEEALRLTSEALKGLGGREVSGDTHIAKISVVGVGMKSHAGVALKMFEALAHENINIQMISTSEIKISCVIADAEVEKAVHTLHDAFGLGESDAGSTAKRAS